MTIIYFFFSSRRRHTRCGRDWSSDVCSSDLGNIIEFQLEDHLKGKNFADETDRIYQLGRLTPNHWMREAVGAEMDIRPMLRSEERRVGKEWRSRGGARDCKIKMKKEARVVCS